MNKTLSILEELESRIRQLAEDYKTLRRQNEQLLNQSKKDQIIIQEQQEQIGKLEARFREIQAGSPAGANKGSEGVRIMITEMVREIDRCIELLNK